MKMMLLLLLILLLVLSTKLLVMINSMLWVKLKIVIVKPITENDDSGNDCCGVYAMDVFIIKVGLCRWSGSETFLVSEIPKRKANRMRHKKR